MNPYSHQKFNKIIKFDEGHNIYIVSKYLITKYLLNYRGVISSGETWQTLP